MKAIGAPEHEQNQRTALPTLFVHMLDREACDLAERVFPVKVEAPCRSALREPNDNPHD